jgi:hypothetical protein
MGGLDVVASRLVHSVVAKGYGFARLQCVVGVVALPVPEFLVQEHDAELPTLLINRFQMCWPGELGLDVQARAVEMSQCGPRTASSVLTDKN